MEHLFEYTVKVANLIFAFFGVIVGWKAFRVYKEANEYSKKANLESTNARLAALDRDAYTEALKNDKLNIIFADFPTPSNIQEALAITQQLIIETSGAMYKNSALEWEHIRELYNIVYGFNNFSEEYRKNLRKAAIHSDLIFYIVDDAFTAYTEGMLPQDYYDTWKAYLYDVGKSPIFILSIYLAYNMGFLDEPFAKELQKVLQGYNKSYAMLNAIYPEMLNQNWPKEIGKVTRNQQAG